MAKRITQLARSQNGVLTRAQLAAYGITDAQIRTRLENGRLHRVHRGVYAVGDPALLPLVAQSAALLAVGAGSVLSHRSAAALWALAKAERAVVDVSTQIHVRSRKGVRIHRVSLLDRRDITIRHNLRLKAPARTLIDLAVDAQASELEHALAEARALRLLTDAKLDAALQRAPDNHPGAARINALLQTQIGRVLTRSQRERLMLSLLDKAQLPRPLVNVRVEGFEVDLYWPAHNLVVEFDGYTTHGSRAAFERDRKRDQILVANAIRVMRVTDRQLLSEPIAVVTRIAQAMALDARDLHAPAAATSAAAGNV